MSKDNLLDSLLHIADRKGLIIREKPLKAYDGLLKGDRIALREGMQPEDVNRILAQEIAHSYLHYDCGNTISSPLKKEYEQQADRAAEMLLDALQFVQS